MATKQTNSENPEVQEINEKKRVKVSLPRGTKNAQYVGVNGVGYLIPAKGEHEVPIEVAKELERALAAEDARDNAQAEMQASARAKQVI